MLYWQESAAARAKKISHPRMPQSSTHISWQRAALAVCLFGATVRGYVWFGYSAARSQWFMTPTTITLEYPQQAPQLHMLEYMPDIRTTGEVTQSCTFWTGNPEWSMTSGGLLSCRVSGQGVCYARVPTGAVISNTISVDPDLPPRILQRPVLPLLPAPAQEVVYIDLRNRPNPGHDDLTPSTTLEVETLYSNGVPVSVTQTVVNVAETVQFRQQNYARKLLAYALQGLVNRHEPRIITCANVSTASEPADVWLPWITNNGARVVRSVQQDALPELLPSYTNEPEINGLLLYPAALYTNTPLADMIHWITVACAVSNLLPVTPWLYGQLSAAVTNRWPVLINIDEGWLAQQGLTNSAAVYRDSLARWWPSCSRRAVAHGHPWLWWENRDYWIAQRIWPFCWRKDATLEEHRLLAGLLTNALPAHAAVIGALGQAVFDYLGDRYAGIEYVITNLATAGSRRVNLAADWHEPARVQLKNVQGVTVSAPQPRTTITAYEIALAADEFIVATNYAICAPLHCYPFTAETGIGVSEFAWWAFVSRFAKTLQYTAVENWSFYAGQRWEQLRPTPLRCAAQSTNALAAGMIAVCGFTSDGDNIGFDATIWPGYWTQTWTASLPLNYGVNPLMYDVAPLQMKWYHAQETACRRIDAEGGAGMMWADYYGLAYGAEMGQALLDDFVELSDQYLAISGLTVLRPELRPTRYAYTRYGQSQYAQGLGGSFLDNAGEQMTGASAVPTNVNGKVWLLHRVRLNANEPRYFLFETQAELNNRSSTCYAVWGAQLWPDQWAEWIDVQTNYAPGDWRSGIPLQVVPAETITDLIRRSE